MYDRFVPTLCNWDLEVTGFDPIHRMRPLSQEERHDVIKVHYFMSFYAKSLRCLCPWDVLDNNAYDGDKNWKIVVFVGLFPFRSYHVPPKTMKRNTSNTKTNKHIPVRIYKTHTHTYIYIYHILPPFHFLPCQQEKRACFGRS